MMLRLPARSVIAAFAGITFIALAPAHAVEIILPVADGTCADGGPFGPFDGTVDRCNWAFAPVGFAGAVTLTTETPASSIEHRMVFEYDLRNVPVSIPLTATLTFTTRGARAVPFPDVNLHLYAYPADLTELPSDFSAGPAALLHVVTVEAMQAPTLEVVDVTELVTTAVQSGVRRVAFRFQIDPNTPHATNQVFIDALDTQPATKPYLSVRSAVPGDADDDGDADLIDFALLTDCLAGPDTPPAPTAVGMTPADCVQVFDRDNDDDVDLDDLSSLLDFFRRE